MRSEPLTAVEMLTLSALSQGALYGYAIAVRIEDLSGGRVAVRPGNLYRVLDRLERRGLVAPAAAPEGEGEEDERRRYFRATKAGRRAAADQLAMFGAVLRESPTLRALVGP